MIAAKTIVTMVVVRRKTSVLLRRKIVNIINDSDFGNCVADDGEEIHHNR